MANYNNNSNLNRSVIIPNTTSETRESLSRTVIENGSPQTAQNNQLITNDSNRSFMSTINELKKKWNDVSSKSKNSNNYSLSPSLQSTKKDLNMTQDSNINRLNEIKSKYSNVSKLKTLNTSQIKK